MGEPGAEISELTDQVIAALVVFFQGGYAENDQGIGRQAAGGAGLGAVAGAEESCIHEIRHGESHLAGGLLGAPVIEVAGREVLQVGKLAQFGSGLLGAVGENDARAGASFAMEEIEDAGQPGVLHVENIVIAADGAPERERKGGLLDFVSRTEAVAPAA